MTVRVFEITYVPIDMIENVFKFVTLIIKCKYIANAQYAFWKNVISNQCKMHRLRREYHNYHVGNLPNKRVCMGGGGGGGGVYIIIKCNYITELHHRQSLQSIFYLHNRDLEESPSVL